MGIDIKERYIEYIPLQRIRNSSCPSYHSYSPRYSIRFSLFVTLVSLSAVSIYFPPFYCLLYISVYLLPSPDLISLFVAIYPCLSYDIISASHLHQSLLPRSSSPIGQNGET